VHAAGERPGLPGMIGQVAAQDHGGDAGIQDMRNTDVQVILKFMPNGLPDEGS
jgi:hypothetical protein